jgi:hypothetical protein
MSGIVTNLRNTFLRRQVSARAARWLAATLLLVVTIWVAGLGLLLGIANRVHVDVPYQLAIKLPLLRYDPELIFAGDSRTFYGVDAGLAAQLLGKQPGYAVNIAYDAGEPLAVLGAARAQPSSFANAHVVLSVAPFIFNEGVRSAGVFPQDVTARLGVVEQLTTYLPLRVGTLIRYIREAFNARLAEQQQVATTSPQVDHFGVVILTSVQPEGKWILRLADHPHFANWNISGPKARYETGALCDLAKLTKRLTVVLPPWAARYNRAEDPVWRGKEDQIAALLTEAGARCGFEVLNIPSVPDLTSVDFADEMHLNASGVPVYTRYLLEQLKR